MADSRSKRGYEAVDCSAQLVTASDQFWMGQYRPFRFQLLPQHFKVGEVETWADAAAHQGVGAVASSCLPASTRHHMEWIVLVQPGLLQF
jgi:hypothetical protein